MSEETISSPKAERGIHKIFLGFAPGVGKTFSMVDEGIRRASRGQHVVVGILDSHGRSATAEHAASLPSIPPLLVGDKKLPELNVAEILKAQPSLVIVDELEHANAPGSERSMRWEDVNILLDHGINVLSTLNVFHLESLRDKTFDITGFEVADTVPDRVLNEAQEIEMIDLTPRALLNRLDRGDIFPDPHALAGQEKLFTERSLIALRELALREAAHRVDTDVKELMKSDGINKPFAATDRVMICLSPTQSSLRLIRRGWRLAQKMNAEVFALFVEEHEPDGDEAKLLKDDIHLAERLQIPLTYLKGKPVDVIIQHTVEHGVTQIVIGHSNRTPLQQRLRGSIINTIIRELKTIDILVVAAEPPKG